MPKIAESVAPLQTHEQDGVERRAAERYPSQAEASCHSAVASNITPFPTRIQNVSTSGIALVLGRRFEPGTLLGINVADPATDYECALLAQVVRVVPYQDGQWLVGCAFTNQLGEEELKALRTEPANAIDADRRAWVRMSCDLRAVCRSGSDQPSGSWCVTVMDVSAGGVRLLSSRALEVGARLSVLLPATKERQARLVTTSVAWRQAEADGQWLLGCEFTPAAAGSR